MVLRASCKTERVSAACFPGKWYLAKFVLCEYVTYFCVYNEFTEWRSCGHDRLVGLVVKASASRAEDPGFESRLRRDFSGSSHTSDLKIGTPVATLPGAWRYRVSAGTGRPGVSIL